MVWCCHGIKLGSANRGSAWHWVRTLYIIHKEEAAWVLGIGNMRNLSDEEAGREAQAEETQFRPLGSLA